MDPVESRQIWQVIEPIHAVTYFAEECHQQSKDLGFPDFWAGYFGARAAPMGAVGPGVVTAVFGGFDPSMVRNSLPAAWTHCTPDDAIEGRAAGAAAALRAAWADPGSSGGSEADLLEIAEAVLDPLSHAIEMADPSGRALFASNADLIPLDDPIADMWQLCTTLREHRGDGHVAVLISEGLSGCEPHILTAAQTGLDTDFLRKIRGWPELEWKDAVTTLTVAGLLDSEGALTERGQTFRDHIESRTDGLAAPAYVQLGEPGRERIIESLSPLAECIAASMIPYPNPIGVSAPGTTVTGKDISPKSVI